MEDSKRIMSTIKSFAELKTCSFSLIFSVSFSLTFLFVVTVIFITVRPKEITDENTITNTVDRFKNKKYLFSYSVIPLAIINFSFFMKTFAELIILRYSELTGD